MTLPFPHEKQKLLREFSTFGIGGPARFFAQAYTADEMQKMLLCSFEQGLQTFILGKGSNSLFDDRGFNGLVILNRIDFLEQPNPAKGIFRAGAGYSFARMGGLTARKHWSGLEFASGIPASVGGAIYMNAGAGGRETADALKGVVYITEKGELKQFLKEELEFGYRISSFQKWKGAIVEGIFELTRSECSKNQQKQLLDYRLKTQPYGEKSAGCAFRNPKMYTAGQLLEELGLKNESVGDARISEKHANFIINQGKAKAQDVLDLIGKVKERVYREKGIILEEEIRFIPYDS